MDGMLVSGPRSSRATPSLREAQIPTENFSDGRKQRGLGKVGLVRHTRTKARMRAPAIIEIQIPAKPGAGLGDTGIGVQIYLFVFHRAPEPLDKHVVAPGRLAIHADRDLVPQQQPGEVAAGKLAALIGVEYLRLAMPGERLLNRLDAEFHLQRDR